MECNFYVGQKVQCIEAYKAPEIAVGNIYTIRDICPVPKWQYKRYIKFPRIGVRLVEIDRMPVTIGHGETEEAVYSWEIFRPLIETDISIFTAMLNAKSLETV